MHVLVLQTDFMRSLDKVDTALFPVDPVRRYVGLRAAQAERRGELAGGGRTVFQEMEPSWFIRPSDIFRGAPAAAKIIYGLPTFRYTFDYHQPP